MEGGHGASLGIDVKLEQTYGILILHRRLVRDYEHGTASSAALRARARDWCNELTRRSHEHPTDD
ncbi:hypothetical protein [Streptomyces sp. OE57]|uniref:hypothetical protein n=1 Tax=Streptomyces lacaronensis TaxID=3379885 RepID=UPI0039B78775